jgi:dolichol-phosphate mannosyltransferase
MKVSIVIPVYNEEKNIQSLIAEIFMSFKNTKYIYEIIIVNDNSFDNSTQAINDLILNDPEIISCISNPVNLGQSKSILNGIEKASHEIIATIDGDGQNNPANLPLLLDKYFSDEKIFLVGGIRKNRKDSFIKKISSKIANKIRLQILNDDCVDTGCSLKVFDKETFLSFPFFDGIHRFLPALFKGYKKKTLFVNVDHRSRKYGISKYGTFKRMIKGIIDTYRVYRIINKIKK